MPAQIQFRMKGADLYDRLGNRLGRLSGNTVVDALNRRLGYVDGEGIFEAGSKRRLAFVRDGQVYDANNNRLGAAKAYTAHVAGVPDGVEGVALTLLLGKPLAADE
jgi:hypothetical protein